MPRVEFVCKLWINLTENLTNTRLSSATGSSSHKIEGKIINVLQLPYSNAKLEATNNLIKLIKRNAFGFPNFDNFKKRIFIALNIKMEKTAIVLPRC